VAAWMDTPTWQLATLPSAPQSWGATPTDQRPNLGKAVSSMTHACGWMAVVMRAASRRRTAVGSQGDWWWLQRFHQATIPRCRPSASSSYR
jgi:hypothetical protein